MTSLVDWKKLDEHPISEPYLKSTQNIFVDRAVPQKYVKEYLQKINQFQSVDDWALIKRRRRYLKYKEEEKATQMNMRYDWESQKTDVHLAIFQRTNDCCRETKIVLESPTFVMVVGNTSGHSYIETPLFGYANSTGGDREIEVNLISREPSAKEIYHQLQFYYLYYVQDLTRG